MLQGQLSDLGVEGFAIRRLCRRGRSAQYVRRPRQPLRLPFGDLGRMDAKLLGSFGQGLVAFTRGRGHLHVERSPVMASRAFHGRAPLVRHPLVASVKPGDHFAHCQNFLSPLSVGSPQIDRRFVDNDESF